jgi:hypothetical protein
MPANRKDNRGRNANTNGDLGALRQVVPVSGLGKSGNLRSQNATRFTV